MAPKPTAAATSQPTPSRQPGAPSRDPLVSPATSHAVAQSVERLKAAVADDTSAKVEQVLRPMLKEWLDKHLPAMVERIVREEIDRIARG
jgi:cell pole-organizing protein PopZ